MDKIWDSVEELRDHLLLDKNDYGTQVVATSMPADPLHVGHVRCLKQASMMGDRLVVIVNGDNFLRRKKGYVFMPLAERLEIIASVGFVNCVLPWESDSQNVAGAIEGLRPDVWVKGGDRTADNLDPEETAACERVGARIFTGVGGTIKKNSSSKLVARFAHSDEKRLCIDVDGVLAIPKGDYCERKPYPFVRDYLLKLRERGFTLVICTARYMSLFDGDQTLARERGWAELRDWLIRYEIPYDQIYLGKPSSKLYLDDRAFTVQSELGECDWESLLHLLDDSENGGV